jgi:hypothetical protein
MHIFNRILVILLDLFMMLCAVVVLLVIFAVLRPVDLSGDPWIVGELTPFTRLDATTWYWVLGLSIAAGVVGLILLIAELNPGPRPESRVVVKRDSVGQVTVTRDGIREVVDREAGRVAGVMDVRSRVAESGDGLHIASRVEIDPAASIPEITGELQQRVKASVEHLLGRPVGQVAVDAQVAPLDLRRSRRRVR